MSLKAKLKLCVLCLILLILGLALSVALLPFLVSADSVRLRLARDLSIMTGYNVQLLQPPALTVFPALQATLPQVVLTDNSADAAPIMTAEKIIVRMSLRDAVRGRTRFTETKLIRPRFTLTDPLRASTLLTAFTHSQGSFGNALRETQDRLQRNEANGKAATPPAHTGATQNTPPAVAAFSQPFGHIIIEDGLIIYPTGSSQDIQPMLTASSGEKSLPHTRNNEMRKPAPLKQTEKMQKSRLIQTPLAPVSEEIRAVYAEIDWPQNSLSATLMATGQWHGTDNSLSVRADNALLLLSGGKSGLRISFNSSQGGITFSGSAQQTDKTVMAEGRLSARSPGLKQSLNWLGMRLPFGSHITTPFVWESAFKTDMRQTVLNNIILTVGNDSGRGALTIFSENTPPHISGSLAFENLTVTLPAAALFTTENTAGNNQHRVEMPVFNLFGLDLRISAEKMVFNDIPIDNAAASVQMTQNGLLLDIGSMQIFDATAQSSLQLFNDNDRITALKLRFSANNANIENVQKILSGYGMTLPPYLKLQGKANIALALQSELPPQPLQKLKNETKKNITQKQKSERQASISNLLPAADARQESQSGENLSYSAVFKKNILPYARGQANLTVYNGKLTSFNMAAFMDKLQKGQNFLLSSVFETAAPADFAFTRLEARCELNNGLPGSLSALLLFADHRLELQGDSDIDWDHLQLHGVFDSARPAAGVQCADTQCLQRSLSPPLQFSARNTFLSAEDTSAPPETGQSGRKSVLIEPTAEYGASRGG